MFSDGQVLDMCDIFLGRSTVENYKSYVQGDASPFMKIFCKEIRLKSRSKHFVEIFMDVTYKLSTMDIHTSSCFTRYQAFTAFFSSSSLKFFLTLEKMKESCEKITWFMLDCAMFSI